MSIEQYKSLIPPLVEQKRFVAILDKTFTAIDKIKNNRTEKNLPTPWNYGPKLSILDFSTNNITNIWCWQQKKLGDVCDFVYGGKCFI